MQTPRIIAVVLIWVLLIVGACAPTPETAAPEPPVLGPDGFITSDLKIPDMEESSGEVSIGVTVTNTGTQEKTHTLELVIDGKVITTQRVTLAGGASRDVTFTTVIGAAGTHLVRIGQVSGKLDWPGPN